MFINTSINRSSFETVAVCKGGGLKFGKNDVSSAVQKIQAFKSLLGNKCFKYFYVFFMFY